ncbi:MAG: hypothetical protein QGG97_05030 [Flavobacteriales bacterium]|jgi:YHS domain-containing protein|nr:hypothetical protein [Flavobacteriales bacterium]|tara:strand:+ start:912 stop:1307 length:396 start_codon:yes stop_codon:yes gene_type:complete
MPVHILGKNNPECPLCKKSFNKASHGGVNYYYCKKDKVQIFETDPMLGVWNNNKSPDDDQAVPCANPACRSEMNIFCRSDGYMKAVCSNRYCGAEVETHAISDGHYDVKKGEGATNMKITKSTARKKWKDN